MKRVMVVFGTRPEAIKLAPVVRALDSSPDHEPVVVSTAQHREMLDQVLDLFEIKPDHDLGVSRPRQQLAALTTRTLDALTPVVESERPDCLIVQGDTTTTLVGALGAFYSGVPVVHLEAGLRTGRPDSPFPEEMNRRLTSQLARLHLAATTQARDNLLAEGVPSEQILVTGNTVIDALLWAVQQNRPVTDPLLAAAEAHTGPVLLWTTHRRESWGSPMRRVAGAVAEIASTHPRLLVVLPAHRNPVVREALLPVVGGLPNVLVGEPTDYWTFGRLIGRASVVLTDSGGIQEEAPSLGKPVLVTRETTERVEAVQAGVARLVGTNPLRIVDAVTELLQDPAAYTAMSRRINPYGDGNAVHRVVAGVDQLLGDNTAVAEFAAEVGPPADWDLAASGMQ